MTEYMTNKFALANYEEAYEIYMSFTKLIYDRVTLVRQKHDESRSKQLRGEIISNDDPEVVGTTVDVSTPS